MTTATAACSRRYDFFNHPKIIIFESGEAEDPRVEKNAQLEINYYNSVDGEKKS